MEKSIEEGKTINLPSKEVIDKMLDVVAKSEETGKEHGFIVGESGKPSRVISGTDKKIDNWKAAYSDIYAINDNEAYSVHLHPLEKDEYGNVTIYGVPEPSGSDSNIESNEDYTQPHAIIGYEQVGENFELRIGFHDNYGKLLTPKTGLNFENFIQTVRKILQTEKK